MTAVWKKTLGYLGLVEEEEIYVDEMDRVEAAQSGYRRPTPVRAASASGTVHTMAPMTARAMSVGSIYKSEPKRFNEAREISDRFKEGTAVIMNLQGSEDAVCRRLVDFASGLVYGLDGKIELVASRVYLLTPADVEVSAEDRERIVGGSFFNQF